MIGLRITRLSPSSMSSAVNRSVFRPASLHEGRGVFCFRFSRRFTMLEYLFSFPSGVPIAVPIGGAFRSAFRCPSRRSFMSRPV